MATVQRCDGVFLMMVHVMLMVMIMKDDSAC